MAIEILLKIIDCKKQPKLLLTGGEGGGITPAGFSKIKQPLSCLTAFTA
jgi:hypothetical protein